MNETTKAHLGDLRYDVYEYFLTGYKQIANNPSSQTDKMMQLFQTHLERHVQVANSFDSHLRSYLPHDGKSRHVEFDIVIQPDGMVQAKPTESKGENT